MNVCHIWHKACEFMTYSGGTWITLWIQTTCTHTTTQTEKKMFQNMTEKKNMTSACVAACVYVHHMGKFFCGFFSEKLSIKCLSNLTDFNRKWKFRIKKMEMEHALDYMAAMKRQFFSLSCPTYRTKWTKTLHGITWQWKIRRFSRKWLFLSMKLQKKNPRKDSKLIDTHFIRVNEWVDLFPQNELDSQI